MDNKFETQSIYKTIFKWKWHILIAVAASIIISIVFSAPFFVTPKYKSVAVVYPKNINVITSEELKTNQLLEILNSGNVKNLVIDEMSLYEHYNIDKNNKYHLYYILKEYKKNIFINKTANMSIVITVYDKDPIVASSIIESIISNCDKHFSNIDKNIAKDLYNSHKEIYEKNEKEIEKLSEEIRELRNKYGLLDKEMQVKECTRAINEGRNILENKEILNNWKLYGDEITRLDSYYIGLLRQQSVNLKTLLDYEREINANKSYCKIISKPYPSDKIAKPVRWLIALISAISVFFASSIGVLMIDSFKKTNN